MANKVLRSLYIDIDYVNKIKKLSARTKVPQSVYVREGIEMMLKKYGMVNYKGVGK